MISARKLKWSRIRQEILHLIMLSLKHVTLELTMDLDDDRTHDKTTIESAHWRLSPAPLYQCVHTICWTWGRSSHIQNENTFTDTSLSVCTCVWVNFNANFGSWHGKKNNQSLLKSATYCPRNCQSLKQACSVFLKNFQQQISLVNSNRQQFFSESHSRSITLVRTYL